MARSPRRAATGAPSVITELPEPVSLPILWDLVDGTPVLAANSFNLAVVPRQDGTLGELVLSAGFLPPPTFGGTPEEQIARLQALGGVHIQPVARLTFSLDRARELRDMFVQLVGAIDPP